MFSDGLTVKTRAATISHLIVCSIEMILMNHDFDYVIESLYEKNYTMFVGYIFLNVRIFCFLVTSDSK